MLHSLEIASNSFLIHLLAAPIPLVLDNVSLNECLVPKETNLVISAIGYKVNTIKGIDLDPTKSFYANKNGHIKNNIYTNGWASGASVGVIGSNKIGASLLVKKILEEIKFNKKPPRETLVSFLKGNNKNYIDKNSWNKINDLEHSQAEKNFTRKKLVNIKDIFEKLSI